MQLLFRKTTVHFDSTILNVGKTFSPCRRRGSKSWGIWTRKNSYPENKGLVEEMCIGIVFLLKNCQKARECITVFY